MELIVLVLGIALIIGLVIRNRGDNTMDTLSKGCGCLFILLIMLIVFIIYIYDANATA
jgi:hypothetical protein